jgi:serine/threonine protein kinase
MMDVATLNALLLTGSTKLNQLTVTERIVKDEDVFKAVDRTDATKNIIIKITQGPYNTNHMKIYENLSRQCNICKLLHYEVVGHDKLVIVMENCGIDLFHFITGRHQITLNLILSISLDLLNQIICLQLHNAMHGDIKIENVAMYEKMDEKGNKTIKATLVDFDEMPIIVEGKVREYATFTTYDLDDATTLMHHYAMKYSALEQSFIQVILSLPVPRMLTPRYNIPTGIKNRRKGPFIFNPPQPPNPDYLNIIDLYSWCYVILILLGILKIGYGTRAGPVEHVFVYRTLLAIVMSMILPNDEPADVPVDVFGSPINADYRHKLVLGITVLMSFLRDVTVANEACTNNKVRLFLKLIQKCTSEEELSSRFNSIVDANSAFYNTNIGEAEADIPTNRAAFVVIDSHVVLAHVDAPSGGTRRTHKKTHRTHAHKKGKKTSKFKRMKRATTRRMRY